MVPMTTGGLRVLPWDIKKCQGRPVDLPWLIAGAFSTRQGEGPVVTCNQGVVVLAGGVAGVAGATAGGSAYGVADDEAGGVAGTGATGTTVSDFGRVVELWVAAGAVKVGL